MVNNSNKTNYSFGGHISKDPAPANSKCELCEKSAVQRYIVNGGVHHNEAPLLCNSCGAEYTYWVEPNSQIDSGDEQASKVPSSLVGLYIPEFSATSSWN